MDNEFLQEDNTNAWHILVGAAKTGLTEAGYNIERLPGRGRSNVWKIEKNGNIQLASIRTTKDRWIAFPPLKDKWKTLDDVDVVVIAAVDDKDDPKNAEIFLVGADDVRDRFNAAYKARIEAGQKVRFNFGMWVCLDRDGRGIAASVGSGIAAANKPIAKYPLSQIDVDEVSEFDAEEADDNFEELTTISDVLIAAKQRISSLAGVEIEKIKIDLKIEH
jgi:hypothetical protein